MTTGVAQHIPEGQRACAWFGRLSLSVTRYTGQASRSAAGPTPLVTWRRFLQHPLEDEKLETARRVVLQEPRGATWTKQHPEGLAENRTRILQLQGSAGHPEREQRQTPPRRHQTTAPAVGGENLPSPPGGALGLREEPVGAGLQTFTRRIDPPNWALKIL